MICNGVRVDLHAACMLRACCVRAACVCCVRAAYVPCTCTACYDTCVACVACVMLWVL